MLFDLSNPLQAEAFNTRCVLLIDRKSKVELSEKRLRSSSQNKYLHAIINYFALQYGESPSYVKQNYFKLKCNKDLFFEHRNDPFVGYIEIVKSSASLSSEDMSVAIDRFRDWAAKEAGIYIPSADEHNLVEQMEIEIERNKRYLYE